MRYMLIIHNDPELHPVPGGPGWDELMAGYAYPVVDTADFAYVSARVDPEDDIERAFIERDLTLGTALMDGSGAKFCGVWDVDGNATDEELHELAVLIAERMKAAAAADHGGGMSQ